MEQLQLPIEASPRKKGTLSLRSGSRPGSVAVVRRLCVGSIATSTDGRRAIPYVARRPRSLAVTLGS